MLEWALSSPARRAFSHTDIAFVPPWSSDFRTTIPTAVESRLHYHKEVDKYPLS